MTMTCLVCLQDLQQRLAASRVPVRHLPSSCEQCGPHLLSEKRGSRCESSSGWIQVGTLLVEHVLQFQPMWLGTPSWLRDEGQWHVHGRGTLLSRTGRPRLEFSRQRRVDLSVETHPTAWLIRSVSFPSSLLSLELSVYSIEMCLRVFHGCDFSAVAVIWAGPAAHWGRIWLSSQIHCQRRNEWPGW